jgi:UMF1 family MFS transporter
MFRLDSAATAIRTSFMSASLWWILFSIPLFVFVREPVYTKISGVMAIFKDSLSRLRKTTLKILNTRTILFFFLAYWLYIDGVHTFVLMAVDFGMSIGLTPSSLMIALIVVQFVAFPAALLFGVLARRFGAYTMILAGIAIYILVCGFGSLMLKSKLDYIILAGITGIAQGGIQALSRSYFGKLIPQQEAAEYFGYYNVVSRFAVILGPAVVGSVAFLTRRAGLESVLASRIGMSSISVLFVAGAVLLLLANKKGEVTA